MILRVLKMRIPDVFCNYDTAILHHAVGLKKVGTTIHIKDKSLNDHDTVTTAEQVKNLLYSNMFWFAIYSTIMLSIIMMLHIYPKVSMYSLYPTTYNPYLLESLPLVRDFHINITICLILSSGLFFILRVYFLFLNLFCHPIASKPKKG